MQKNPAIEDCPNCNDNQANYICSKCKAPYCEECLYSIAMDDKELDNNSLCQDCTEKLSSHIKDWLKK